MNYKEETKEYTSAIESSIRIPRAASFTLNIKASHFNSNYMLDEGSSRRQNVLIEKAVIDQFSKDSGVEIFYDSFDGIVTSFAGFVVVKNKIYKHRIYGERSFERDARIAKFYKYSDRVIRRIVLAPCEIITHNQPENLN